MIYHIMCACFEEGLNHGEAHLPFNNYSDNIFASELEKEQKTGADLMRFDLVF